MKIIQNKMQYFAACNMLEEKIDASKDEEAEHLMLLIRDYDERTHPHNPHDPPRLINSILKEHSLDQAALAEKLDLDVNDFAAFLTYEEFATPDIAKKLANHFKIREDILLAQDQTYAKKVMLEKIRIWVEDLTEDMIGQKKLINYLNELET